jgi:hypothetical protein
VKAARPHLPRSVTRGAGVGQITTGTLLTHFGGGPTRKHHGTEKSEESRNCCCGEWMGCGHRGHGSEFGRGSPSCNPYQTLIDCLLVWHLLCAQRRPPRATIVGTSCKVLNRKSRYPPRLFEASQHESEPLWRIEFVPATPPLNTKLTKSVGVSGCLLTTTIDRHVAMRAADFETVLPQ